MFMLDGEYYSASEEENERDIPSYEDAIDDEEFTMVESGRVVVARRALNIQV